MHGQNHIKIGLTILVQYLIVRHGFEYFFFKAKD